MNRKGQALIEFVLIFPILILILFAIIDFGNIFYSKYELQNQSSDVIRLVQNGSTEQEIMELYSKLEIKIEIYDDDYKKISLIRKINLITPMMDSFLPDPYLINIERIVPNG